MTTKKIAFDFEGSIKNDPLKPGGVEGLKNVFWPILNLLRDEGLYLGFIPSSRDSIPNDYKIYFDDFTPFGRKVWTTVGFKFLGATDRDGHVTPRKISNMLKNFEKLKAEYQEKQNS